VVRHLYVHVPFCARICPYCAFYVHRGGAEAQREFVQALRQEWRQARAEFPLGLETIYFGGGTPSILSAELFTELAQEMGDQRELREFTLEVNPATVTPAKAEAWRAAGVNRISLGAQSFHRQQLELLGRQHAPEDVPLTCELLRRHGFTNINIDLIFGVPGQTEADWADTLRAAIACAPTHLSAYALTYEEDTPFFEKLQQGIWQQDETTEIALFKNTRTILEAEGFTGYEISNFARPGFESRHNFAYWRGEDYLGLGPSACSTLDGRRWKNVPDTAAYQERLAKNLSLREEMEEISAETRRRERIMFGLRLREGVPRREFVGAESALEKLHSQGLAMQTDDRICLTPRGRLVADSVAAMFV
jgi:oxygen-independent coproporphyrinogen-3 oxidase